MALASSQYLLELLRQEWILADASLVEAERLASLVPEPHSLTQNLVQSGHLTQFQADLILQDRTAELILEDCILLEPLGEGTVGRVYKARHRTANHLVAVKIIWPELLATPQAMRRFERGIDVIRHIDHPNIARALDASHAGQTPFMVMEFIEGIDLLRLVEKEGPLPVALACDFARQTALGLQLIHDRGGIHRDIKPQNLMAAYSKSNGDLLSAGSYEAVKILDLGLGVLRPPESDGQTVLHLTGTGMLMGTPDFMAPEQAADGRNVDIRADLYSLGCVLYYLLTGHPLYPGGTVAQKAYQHRQLPIPDIRVLRPGVPEGLARLLRQFLAKKRENRFPTPREAAMALVPFCAEEGGGKGGQKAVWPLPPPLPAEMQAAASVPLPVWGRAGEWSVPEIRPWNGPGRGRGISQKSWILVLGGGFLFSILLGALLVFLLNRGGEDPGALAVKDPPGKDPPGKEGKLPDKEGKGVEKPLEPKSPGLPRVFQSFPGHTNTVTNVAVSRDGKRLYSASWDETIKIWDLEAGREVRTLFGHTGCVWGLTLSADGTRLYSGSFDRTIKVWDVMRGEEIQTLRGHTNGILSLVLTPDGKRLISASQDQTIKVWDLGTGVDVRTLRGHTDEVYCLALNPDGKRLYSGSQDRTIKVWDVDTGLENRTLHGHSNGVYALVLSPDGKHLYSGSQDNTLKVWDLGTGVDVRTLRGHTDFVMSLVLLEDGNQVISSSFDRTIKVWDLKGVAEVLTLREHSGEVWGLARSKDGKRLYSGSSDRTVKSWDIWVEGMGGPPAKKVEVVKKVDEKKPPEKFLGPRKAGPPRDILTLRGSGSSIYSMVLSPDGKRLYSGAGDKNVTVWDAETGNDLNRLRGHTNSIISLTMTKDGKKLYTGCQDSTIKVWDLDRGEEERTLRLDIGDIGVLTLSPDGKRLFAGGGGGIIKVVDLASGVAVQTLKGHTALMYGLIPTGDGRLISGSQDHTIRVWNLATGLETNTLRNHTDWVMNLLPSRDGKKFFSSSWDRTIRVWNQNPVEEERVLRGHTDFVLCLAQSPDGRWLFSGSGDKTLKVWDLRTGVDVFTLRGHGDSINTLTVSPDGRRLYSGSWDQTIMVWDIWVEDLR